MGDMAAYKVPTVQEVIAIKPRIQQTRSVVFGPLLAPLLE